MASEAKLITGGNAEKMTSKGVDHTTHYHNLHLFISSTFSTFLNKTVKNYFQLDKPFIILNGLIELLEAKFLIEFDPLLYFLQIKYPGELNVLVDYCVPFREGISQGLIDRAYTFDNPTSVLVENTQDTVETDQVPLDEKKANILWYFLMILELFQGTIRGIFPTWFARQVIDALKKDISEKNIQAD